MACPTADGSCCTSTIAPHSTSLAPELRSALEKQNAKPAGPTAELPQVTGAPLMQRLPVVPRSEILTFSRGVISSAAKRGRSLLPSVAPMANESEGAIAAGDAAALRTLHEAFEVLSSETWRDWSPRARAQRWAYAGRAEMNL